MKKLSTILLSSIFIIILSGCGDDSGGGGDMNSLMGGGGDMDMGTLMGGGGDMDMSALMGGGGMDMSALMGSEEEGGEGSSSSNPPPPSYADRGDVFVTYENKEYFLKAVAKPDPNIIQPSYEFNEKEDINIVKIAGYDTRASTPKLVLVFTFAMEDITTTGIYDLATPAHKSGYVRVDRAKFVDDSTLNMKGVIKNAEIYSMDGSQTFLIEIEFDVDVAVTQPTQ